MNVLFIGAHFDDVELGCGGTIAKFSKENHRPYIYVATTSGYSDYNNIEIRGDGQALMEGKKAAKILGAQLLTDNYQTKSLECNFGLIEKINAIIDEKKIECVFTHWDNDVHQDHRNLALATLSAARHVPRLLMYRSNWYYSSSNFSGNFMVDISSTIKVKIKSVEAFKSEYERRGKRWIDFFIDENINNGKKIGVKYAEAFKIIKYLI